MILEQAKGAIASSLEIDVDAAFDLMRAYARSHNLRLGDIARQVLDGTLAPATLQP